MAVQPEGWSSVHDQAFMALSATALKLPCTEGEVTSHSSSIRYLSLCFTWNIFLWRWTNGDYSFIPMLTVAFEATLTP